MHGRAATQGFSSTSHQNVLLHTRLKSAVEPAILSLDAAATMAYKQSTDTNSMHALRTRNAPEARGSTTCPLLGSDIVGWAMNVSSVSFEPAPPMRMERCNCDTPASPGCVHETRCNSKSPDCSEDGTRMYTLATSCPLVDSTSDRRSSCNTEMLVYHHLDKD